MLAVFLIALFGLVLIGVPIAFSLVGTGFFMMLTQALSRPASWSVFALAQRFVNGCDSVPLLAIPFFMIAGEIMTRGGISKRIVDFAYSVLGRFKGGLGYVGILASMIFAGVSGSAVADTTAVGSMLLPIMGGAGYDKKKATGIVCCAGCIGPTLHPDDLLRRVRGGLRVRPVPGRHRPRHPHRHRPDGRLVLPCEEA